MRIYHITAGFLAMVMFLLTIVTTGQCAAMNMKMDMPSNGIMPGHMMANHACCNMNINMPEHKTASNILNSGTDWCQCQIAQPLPINSLTIINTPVDLHYYPVVLAAVDITPIKTDEQTIRDFQLRPDNQVPLFIRNLSLLN